LSNNLFATRSYTDIVHKAIPYSGLEDNILTSPPLLRLQRISQNSLVYLTFVSNKVKRFEHSLGVMHLAGKLFYSAVANTQVKILKKMFDKFKKELNDWITPGPIKQAKITIYGNVKNFELTGREMPFVGLYNANTPPFIQPQLSMLYASIYQGVRIAGLLHDIGHLPYSHTLENILEILRNKWGKVSKKNKTQKYYIELVDAYKKNSFDKLHEAISMRLFSVVETECIKNVKHDLDDLEKAKEITEENKNDYLVFCLYSLFLTK